MDNAEILAKVKDIAAEKLDVAVENVEETSSFIEDLGADSLDVVELIMGLEDEFEIEISDDEAEKIATVTDAVTFISERI